MEPAGTCKANWSVNVSVTGWCFYILKFTPTDYLTSSHPHPDRLFLTYFLTNYREVFLWHNIYIYIYSDILPDIFAGIPSGILSDILFGIVSDIYSVILSGILSGSPSHILSDIHSGILSGNLSIYVSFFLCLALFGIPWWVRVQACPGPGVPSCIRS